MGQIIFVPGEAAAGEPRVAASPDTVKRLVGNGFDVIVEAGAGDRWWIGVEDENLIEPPVRYGETPDGVPAETALPLEDGETYEVILWLSTPAGDRLVAVEEFQR